VADLQQELAVLGELEDLGVLLAVAADPHITLVVDVDAVIGLRPLVALAGAAPCVHQFAVRIEGQHRRRAAAALGDRRIELGAFLIVVERGGAAVDDPDIVLLVGPDPDRHAEQALERLGPERIDFEHRRLHIRALRLGLVLQHRLADAEPRDRRDQHGARDESTPCYDVDHDGLPNRSARAASPLRCGDYRQADRACNGRPSARNVNACPGSVSCMASVRSR
jgi:hypothetical protein